LLNAALAMTILELITDVHLASFVIMLPKLIEIPHSPAIFVGRDSSVGIAIGYGLDGPGIESLWGRARPWGLPSLLENRYRVFPGGKAAGAWC
jgi:hypothetical protein